MGSRAESSSIRNEALKSDTGFEVKERHHLHAPAFRPHQNPRVPTDNERAQALKYLQDKQKVKEQKAERKLKRKIVLQTQKEQAAKCIKNDVAAVFGGKISVREWSAMRMRQYGQYGPEVPQHDHSGNHDHLYSYEKDTIVKELDKLSDGKKDLGEKMHLKWAELARKANFKSLTGATNICISHVIQSFAKSQGYSFTVAKRRKRSWLKHEDLGIAVYHGNSAPKLVAERNRMIADGEIDIGRLICPVSKLLHRGQHIVNHITYGRVVSLQSIRSKHLMLMHEKGLLRKTDTTNMTDDECKKLLDKRKVLYPATSSVGELRAIMERSETKRSYVLWHDHSDISGHSHYVISVWFMFDPAVYLTEKEVGYDVQSAVERPYIHMIGRSGSSHEQQLLYVPERISELQGSVQINFNGRQYTDTARFFTGDLLAREFEAGQTGASGNYPCPCGARKSTFQNSSTALQIPPFNCIADRVDQFGEMPHDFSYRIRTLKKPELQQVIKERGFGHWLHEKKNKEVLQDLLTREMKGVDRLPALLTTGLSLDDISCLNYEIIPSEPLHDFKNLIHNIMLELPLHIKEKRLSVKIKNFCDSILGEKRILKGCDARMHLINLTIMLQEPEFQLDRQCADIAKTLSALTDIQHLAYQLDDKRCSRDLMKFHLVALKFVTGYTELFINPKNLGIKKMFGSPYHSIVAHMPEMYRVVSLRSIVAEAAERQFHELRQLARSSNNKTENVLLNIIFRTEMRQKIELEDHISKSFVASQLRVDKTQVSLAAKQLKNQQIANRRTILTPSFIERNKMATVWTLRRIADFIGLGHGVWYETLQDGSLMFYDGENDERERGSPLIKYYRDVSSKIIAEEIEHCWTKCLQVAGELRISVLTDLAYDEGTMGASSNEGEEEKSIHDSEDIESLSNLSQKDTTTYVQSNQQTPSLQDTVIDTNEDFFEGAKPTTSEKALEVAKPTTSEQAKSKEQVLVTEWIAAGYTKSIIENFLHRKRKFECNNSKVNLLMYKASYNQVAPGLKGIIRKHVIALNDMERQYFKTHKVLATQCVSPAIEERRQICQYYLGVMK